MRETDSDSLLPATTIDENARGALRRSVYALLALIVLGATLGRILAVNSTDRVALDAYRQQRDPAAPSLQRPFLSANDRSRWCTVRALVEHGTYAIDRVTSQPGWDTIDMVKHDGHLYSSKPTLLATLMAGEYWVIYRLTGATLGTHPYEIGRFMLATINLGTLIIYFGALARLIERYGTTDWGRIFVFAAACFGTFLTTFAVAINNHLIAAAGAAVTIDAVVRIVWENERRWRWFFVAGFAAAFTAANELPALALTVPALAAILWRAPRPALYAALPAVMLVLTVSFGTNRLAHGTWSPPYAHRHGADNWYDYTFVRDGRVRESYWRNPAGVDRGEPSIARYSLHALVGHHGIFSLTPIWLLTAFGCARAVQRREWPLWPLAAMVAIVSTVCVVFYLQQPMRDRNYGGLTSGFRWAFWLAPLWLVTMLPTADALARSRWGRGLGLVLLALSVMSASYPTWNPWSHPWLMRLFAHLGWAEL